MPDTDENDDQKEKGQIENIAKVKLPPFWTANPTLWFVQAEAQFAMCKITNDSTKYHLAIASLPGEACESIYDILTQPPDTEKYNGLKKTLISRNQLSEEVRLEKLLEKADLGDRKPSDLLRQMKMLARESISEKILQKLWLRRLPAHTTSILMAIADKSLDELQNVADKIFESHQTNTNAIFDVSVSNEFTTRLDRIEAMLNSVNFQNGSNRSRERSRSRNGSRNSSNSRNQKRPNTWCWYHARFQNMAKKCIKPCTFDPNFSGSKINENNPNPKN